MRRLVVSTVATTLPSAADSSQNPKRLFSSPGGHAISLPLQPAAIPSVAINTSASHPQRRFCLRRSRRRVKRMKTRRSQARHKNPTEIFSGKPGDQQVANQPLSNPVAIIPQRVAGESSTLSSCLSRIKRWVNYRIRAVVFCFFRK